MHSVRRMEGCDQSQSVTHYDDWLQSVLTTMSLRGGARLCSHSSWVYVSLEELKQQSMQYDGHVIVKLDFSKCIQLH